jgi:hypothetical protein
MKNKKRELADTLLDGLRHHYGIKVHGCESVYALIEQLIESVARDCVSVCRDKQSEFFNEKSPQSIEHEIKKHWGIGEE